MIKKRNEQDIFVKISYNVFSVIHLTYHWLHTRLEGKTTNIYINLLLAIHSCVKD